MRVVIADDDVWVRRTLRAALMEPQVDIVGEAPDGATALLKVAEKRPELLITDIRMPYLDGILLTQYLTKAYEDLTVVGFTGDDHPEALVAAGAAEVFVKPDVEALVDSVLRLADAVQPRVRGSFG